MTASPVALLDLLNRIIKPENPFVEVEFLNTEVAPDAQGEKAVCLDLLVRCKSGRVVDVEIQSGYASKLEKRSIFYAARLVSESLWAGQSYDSMPESIVIFIIEGDWFQDTSKTLNYFQFVEGSGNPPSFRPLHPNSPKIHFLELGKLVSSSSQEDPILRSWVDFMLPHSVSDWQGVAGEFTMFLELKKKVETYSADNKLAMQQRAIDEAKVAHTLEMGGVLCRGREEGRKAR